MTQVACPIKVLEYMASARPLIASNILIVRELVREDLARQVLTLLLNDFH